MDLQLYCHRALCTSVAVGVEEGGGVWEAGAVGVVVDGSDPRLIPTTVFPRDVDGITDAAICQPAGITLVQTSLPSQVELSNSGQLGSQRVAVGGGSSEAQLLRHCGVENLTWKM